MNLTRKQEKEIHNVYDEYWQSYFSGDVRTFSGFLTDGLNLTWTAEEEVYFNKKDTIKLLKATRDQVAGKAELRNRDTNIKPVGELVMINENSDLYIQVDGKWNFYSKIRITSFLRKIKNEWKFIQQHCSFPDSKTEKGETFAFEQIKTENLSLREAVKRRTAELEQKNRELEFESSLERVRTIAMAMHKSEDLLNVCEKLFNELKILGFDELRNTMINIHNDEEETFLNYDYSDTLGKTITPLFYDINPVIAKQIKHIRKSRDAFSETSFKGDELKEWKRFRKKRGEPDDPRIKNTKALYYYFYSIGTGSIGISTFSPLTKDKLILLKRFRNVFNLAYRRYIDVTQAEAQTREAKIEASLERVRARSMAMHHSSELVDASVVLFNELKSLGIEAIRTGVAIVDSINHTVEIWSSQLIEKERNKILGVVPFKTHPFFEAYYKSWKRKEPFFFYEIAGSELKKYYKKMSSLLSYPEVKEFNPREIFYTFFFPEGSLNVVSKNNLSEEECRLITRFAKVFGMIYRRFLDLQKAEAQAREAQIEVALERVRSRTMAMHSSDELQEAAVLLFQQISDLGVNTGSCGYIIWRNTKKDATVWMSSPEGSIQEPFNLPHTKSKIYREIFTAKESGKDFFVKEVRGRELRNHFDFLTTVPGIGEKIKKLRKSRYKFPETIVYNIAFFKQGYLSFHTYEQDPESQDIFIRFAKVFEQTYTRFLDLQKAEAQAREAQIEVALERVRSKTMSMHNSENVGETVVTMFEELAKLGIKPFRCGIGIFNSNKQLEAWAARTDGDNKTSIVIGKLDMTSHPLLQGAYEGWRKRKSIFEYELKGKDVLKYFKVINKLPDYPVKYDISNLPKRILHHDFYFPEGTLFVFTLEQLSDEAYNIFKRFASVFGQTYRRYLDLQKAEEQAKEAQIEAALERVRSRTMGMQKSEELKEVIQVVYEQFVQLNTHVEHAGFIMDYKNRDDMNIWLADKHIIPFEITIPYFDSPHWNSFIEARKNGKDFFANHLNFEEKNKFYQDLFKLFPVPDKTKKYYFNCAGLAISTVLLDNVGLYIENFSGIPYSDEENAVLMRFGKVFQQTYTRFLDLKKAEAQARESRIEAALEKVRGKAMAMDNSDDLTDAAGMVFTELNNLGIKSIRSGFVLLTNESRTAKLYPATSFDNINTVSFTGEFEFTGHPVFEKQYEIWKKKENYFPVLEGDLLKSYYKILAEGLSVPYENFPTNKKQHGTFLPFSEGFLFTWSDEPYKENEINILDRFKNILDLTIRRYIDLKNAEAQSRESQIEASLERVRSKAMAMQKSDDLAVAVATIFEQLDKLDLGIMRCGIGIINREKKSVDVWASAIDDNESVLQLSGDESMDIHPLLQGAFDAWLRQEDFSYILQGEDLTNYYESQTQSNFKLPESQSVLAQDTLYRQYYYVAVFQSGGLFAFRETEFPEEAKTVIKRFADVINFTYTRFNDLKQAEAQAKEAKIEAALERVRAGSLIMRKPEDMFDVCKVISEQLILLNVNEIRNTQTVILNEGKETYQNYEYFPDYNEKTFSEIDFNLHPKVTEFVNEIKKSSEAFFTTSFEGKGLQEWRDYRKNTNQIPDAKLDAASSVHYYFYSIGPGALGISTYAPLSEEHINIFKRFRNVFELAYRRYRDIEQAEAQAREAQIEAALERVRSRTLAMQKSDELAETAAVVFKQLISLGIEPNRLYIGIINDDSGDIEAWATDEDGSRVSKEFTLNIHANASVKKMFDGWAAKKNSVTIDMQGSELESYLHYLSDVLNVPFKGGLTQGRRVQNIAYFSKGFIGMASPDPQPEETAELLERFAAVFNLTFTRFNDLQIAEKHAEQAALDLIKLQTEKKRAEEALTELRSTQAQLIQSEKMASLGELTAGIAHEIQNPLNFVNNFSEVNTELIDELNQEIEKGNFDEAVMIAKDIKDNEEKIKHHGKRAEGIVKGMLQHSRSSSGVKEPTDINALADEYLRLAYHGLRAKDKTFNAKMETDFDDSIGEINIVPQDIGRVILNLITNAFYAVDEKKKTGVENYEPVVSVSTKKTGDKVEVKVKDNGNGIPEKVMDKIFQPFFTTKPAGQGTGLGLSMSYDIIKAHGGELKVETKEGVGAEFTILFPIV